jgi:hypothetical protein
LTQRAVAEWFEVTPARVCQIVRRVREWVDDSLGDWLFPGRDDLRFYAALQCERIRVHESEHEPFAVVLVGPDWRYTREIRTPAASDPPPPGEGPAPLLATANTGAFFSAQPINSSSAAAEATLDATSSEPTDSLSSAIDDMARQLAQLLIIWKKSRKLSAAVKMPSTDH